IAFTLIGNKATINPKVNGDQIGMGNKVRAMGYGDDDKYPSPGFQKEEFLTKLRFTGAINNGKGSFTLNWEDAVIYDKDGIRNKPGDDMSGEIKFSGKIGLDDIYTEGGIEWHPDYIGGLFDHGKWLPNQMKFKWNYKRVADLELKGKTEFSTEEFVQKLNSGFKNEAKLFGLDISGVETFNKKWVIGAVGLRLVSKTGVGGNINQIAQQSSLADPIIMLFIFIDIDGNITVEGGIKTENSTSYVSGFNIQRNGFVGSYGSQADNFSAEKHIKMDGYTFDIYDSTENKNSFSVYGKAAAELKLGAGLGAGLMVAGLCPATVTGEVFVDSKMEAELEGKLEIPLKNSKIDGKANMVASLGATAEADFRVIIDKTDKPSWEFKFHQEWPKSLGELINIQFPKENKKKESVGKVVVDFKYDEVRKFSEEMAAVKVSGKWGFINKSGKEVIKPEYDVAFDFENGFAGVKLNGRWGFINKKGKVVVPIKYNAVLPIREGLAGVIRGFIFEEAGYVDTSGNEVVPFKFYGGLSGFSGGLAHVSLSGRHGFINKLGEVVIPLKYDEASGFSENMATVKMNGKWGAIDRSGTEIIPLKYDAISYENDKFNDRIQSRGFREGMLSVKLNGKWGYVNQYGVEIVPMLFDEVAIFFRGGMASVRLNDKWGYVNLSGDIVVQPKYDDVNDFFDDLTSVSLNGKWGYVDKAGKEIIPLKYDYAKEFNDGLGAVKVGDKWGYIDKTGKEVIPFIYEDADYFSESLAAVKKDGKWGFIKK
ncbi:MAG: WG repeat-containing protein, partial [Catonella sp.]|uniref:WG repeat-containing protein n=1 Tax=Catonella sp. TaxID=2382125 RepID=UPI003F9FE152